MRISSCEAPERIPIRAIHEWTNGNGRNWRRPKAHNPEINSFRRCRMMDLAVSYRDRLQLCIISTVCINHFSAEFSCHKRWRRRRKCECRFNKNVSRTLSTCILCVCVCVCALFRTNSKWTEISLQFNSLDMAMPSKLIAVPFDCTHNQKLVGPTERFGNYVVQNWNWSLFWDFSDGPFAMESDSTCTLDAIKMQSFHAPNHMTIRIYRTSPNWMHWNSRGVFQVTKSTDTDYFAKNSNRNMNRMAFAIE